MVNKLSKGFKTWWLVSILNPIGHLRESWLIEWLLCVKFTSVLHEDLKICIKWIYLHFILKTQNQHSQDLAHLFPTWNGTWIFFNCYITLLTFWIITNQAKSMHLPVHEHNLNICSFWTLSFTLIVYKINWHGFFSLPIITIFTPHLVWFDSLPFQSLWPWPPLWYCHLSSKWSLIWFPSFSVLMTL